MRKLCSYYFHAFLNSSYYTSITIEQQLRRLCAGFSPRRPWFSPRSLHGGHSGTEADFLQVHRFLPANCHSIKCPISLISQPELVQWFCTRIEYRVLPRSKKIPNMPWEFRPKYVSAHLTCHSAVMRSQHT
jgi:hypothetical protein